MREHSRLRLRRGSVVRDEVSRSHWRRTAILLAFRLGIFDVAHRLFARPEIAQKIRRNAIVDALPARGGSALLGALVIRHGRAHRRTSTLTTSPNGASV